MPTIVAKLRAPLSLKSPGSGVIVHELYHSKHILYRSAYLAVREEDPVSESKCSGALSRNANFVPLKRKQDLEGKLGMFFALTSAYEAKRR